MKTIIFVFLTFSFMGSANASLCEGLLLPRGPGRSCDVSPEFLRRMTLMTSDQIDGMRRRFSDLRRISAVEEMRRLVGVEDDIIRGRSLVASIQGNQNILDFIQMVVLPECNSYRPAVISAPIIGAAFLTVNAAWLAATLQGDMPLAFDVAVGGFLNYGTYLTVLPVYHNAREKFHENEHLRELSASLSNAQRLPGPIYFHRDVRRIWSRYQDRMDVLFSYVNGEPVLDIVIRRDVRRGAAAL